MTTKKPFVWGTLGLLGSSVIAFAIARNVCEPSTKGAHRVAMTASRSFSPVPVPALDRMVAKLAAEARSRTIATNDSHKIR